MNNPTRVRAFTNVIIVALALLIGFVFSLTFVTKYYVSAQQEHMLELYEDICDIYGDPINESLYSENKREEMGLICEQAQVTLYVCDASGEAIFSYGDAALLENRLSDVLFGQDTDSTVVYENDDFIIQNVSEDNSIKYIEMWGFLDNGYCFIARTSYSAIQNSVSITMRFFAFVSLTVVFIISILVGVVSRSYSHSMRRLIKIAQETNEGNFEYKYENKFNRHDEIGVLGDNLAQLSEKLEKTISELKTSNLNLENELKAKIALEEARKKYMSDVSHELKTPLALISGYAEGLKEGVGESKEDREYYLDVIIDEAEKMNVIIKRLATLNQLEQGKGAVYLERFNVVEAIDGFLNTMHIVIEEHEADIFFNNKTPVYVWTDEFLFEEVLVNYFNNALNHLDEHKIIRINVENLNNGNVRVTVFNSGENIAPEEIDKIWTKFYKVDKARTRAYGGSGLGLSIVKAVADSLGKECGAYNREDGVAFWIDLEAASSPDVVMDAAVIEEQKLIEIPRWGKSNSAAKKKTKKSKDSNKKGKENDEDQQGLGDSSEE